MRYWQLRQAALAGSYAFAIYQHSRWEKGICGETGKVLSDEELIRAAVEYQMARLRPLQERVDKLALDDTRQYQVPYDTLEKFFEVNANCCNVTYRSSTGKRFGTRLGLKKARALIAVKYTKRLASRPKVGEHVTVTYSGRRSAQILMNNCRAYASD